MPYAPFTSRVIRIIRAIPRGRLSTYGLVARMAGSPRAARQVVRILHTLTEKEALPWQRVLGRDGRILLKSGQGLEEQQTLLEGEGILFGPDGGADLERYLWTPARDELVRILAGLAD